MRFECNTFGVSLPWRHDIWEVSGQAIRFALAISS